MDLNPELAGMTVRLAELGARGTVTSVRSRISASKAAKQDRQTIEALEEIVDELIADRAEILGIAQSFEAELIAERISDEDIAFVTSQLAPKLEESMKLSSTTVDSDEIKQMVGLLLSKETLKILQVLGFNFRDAIGRPLTELVARLINTQGPVQPQDPDAIQQLNLQLQDSLAKLSLDEAAYDRFRSMIGR